MIPIRAANPPGELPVSTRPTKTAYIVGNNFDYTAMVTFL